MGKASHVLILHDDSCTPSACSCSPEFVLEELTVDSYKAGQLAQTDWVRKSTN